MRRLFSSNLNKDAPFYIAKEHLSYNVQRTIAVVTAPQEINKENLFFAEKMSQIMLGRFSTLSRYGHLEDGFALALESTFSTLQMGFKNKKVGAYFSLLYSDLESTYILGTSFGTFGRIGTHQGNPVYVNNERKTGRAMTPDYFPLNAVAIGSANTSNVLSAVLNIGDDKSFLSDANKTRELVLSSKADKFNEWETKYEGSNTAIVCLV